MTRELARELKNAGFPVGAYRVGHVFYPPAQGGEWSENSRRHGVTITPYDLDEHMHDIRDGYYCPDIADLIEACGERFARLWVSTSIWTAESEAPAQLTRGNSAEEAMAKLWLALNKSSSSHGAAACGG
jgi:hypothetical protein